MALVYEFYQEIDADFAKQCLDAGEKALASRVEFAGRIAVVLLALPLFEEIAEAVLSLVGASK